MGVSYEDAVKAQAELENQILADPNVVSVGVIAEINELGEKTGDYIIKVGVISSADYQHSVAHGDSIIPQEYVIRQGDGKQELKSVRVQVVKTGRIKALSVSDGSEKKDFPSAADNIPTISSGGLNDHTARRRPVPGGYSIGHPIVTAGTFGLLLEYEEGPHAGKVFILSNNHVIAANNLAHVGDPIIQPGRHDSGVVGQDTIAFLHRWVPLEYTGINFVDAAIAEVKGGVTDWSHYVMPYVSHIGYPSHPVDVTLGMQVEKTGRTTGYTTGAVISINQVVKVDYGNVGILTYKNQICTTNMATAGDSGSCLFESGTKKPVGLLFACDDSESYHNPIRPVLSLLSMRSTNQYSSGKTHKFASDYPLRIFQKRSYSTYAASNFYGESAALARNLKIPLTKYTAVLAVTSVGICAVTKKLASIQSSIQLRGKAEGLLSKALASCSFFKLSLPAQVTENIDSIPGIKFKR